MHLSNSSKKLAKILLSLGLISATLACGDKDSGNDSSLKDTIVVGADSTSGLLLELGNGYSEKTGTFLKSPCVIGASKTQNSSLSKAEVQHKVDADYNYIVDSLAGSINASINLGAINASAGAELAKKVAKTKLTTNIYHYVTMIGKSETLSSSGRMIGPGILRPGVSPESYCGTHFVSQIDYGASMAIALEIQAKTEQQLDKIKGALKVNILDFVEVDGSLEKLDQKEYENYTVNIRLEQIGGKTHNLVLAIPAEGYSCDINSLKSCIEKFNAAIAYMKGQLRSDLEDISNWVPVNYHVVEYKDTADLASLAPRELTREQTEILRNAEKMLRVRYQETMRDSKDAITLRESDALSAGEQQELDEVIAILNNNVDTLNEAILDCQNDYKYCMSISSNPALLKLQSYNNNFRSLGFEKAARRYCDDIIARAAAVGSLTENERRGLMLDGTAPVFEDSKNLTSRVIGFAPCENVYKTLFE